jgi:hypothetical protein
MAEQSMPEQSYAKHAKVVPMYLVAGVTLLAAFILSLVTFYRRIQHPEGRLILVVLVLLSVGCLLLFGFARTFALKVQDRAIRAEENLRHFALTGKLLDHRLSIKQIVGLRFASDAEFPELARKAADQGMPLKEIKQAVKNWRADHDRA